MNGMKMTRRTLAGLIAAPALFSDKGAVPVKAQAQARTTAPAPAESAVNAAHADFQSAARQLARVKLPRIVEPVTRFEA
jgi:hypothetical protein